jgi:hypothetical protein
MTHMETCVQYCQPKIPKSLDSLLHQQKMTVTKPQIHVLPMLYIYIYISDYLDYKCVSTVLPAYILEFFGHPSKAKNPRNPTLKHSPAIILFSEHLMLFLMASPNSFFVISFFFIFSFLLLLQKPLPVTSFHYRSLLNLVNATASTNLSKNHHKWVGPVGHRLISVDVNGSADFRSVQAAVDSVPVNNTQNVVIQISAGYYM